MPDESCRNVDSGPGPKATGAGLDAARVRRTLTIVLDHVAPRTPGVEYRVVGTAATTLQGVPVPVGDIDLLFRDRPGVDRFGAALAAAPAVECLLPPTDLGDAPQYFARYVVDGAMVELSTVEVETTSDTAECIGRGPWEHAVPVACGRHVVPAVALEVRLLTELGRNRPDRYHPIAGHLRAHGCDVTLLRRGLANMGGALPDDGSELSLTSSAAARPHLESLPHPQRGPSATGASSAGAPRRVRLPAVLAGERDVRLAERRSVGLGDGSPATLTAGHLDPS